MLYINGLLKTLSPSHHDDDGFRWWWQLYFYDFDGERQRALDAIMTNDGSQEIKKNRGKNETKICEFEGNEETARFGSDVM